jgi:hypothetical protein
VPIAMRSDGSGCAASWAVLSVKVTANKGGDLSRRTMVCKPDRVVDPCGRRGTAVPPPSICIRVACSRAVSGDWVAPKENPKHYSATKGAPVQQRVRGPWEATPATPDAAVDLAVTGAPRALAEAVWLAIAELARRRIAPSQSPRLAQSALP